MLGYCNYSRDNNNFDNLCLIGVHGVKLPHDVQKQRELISLSCCFIITKFGDLMRRRSPLRVAEYSKTEKWRPLIQRSGCLQ